MFRARKRVQIGRGLGGLLLGFLPRLIPVIKTAAQWIGKAIRGSGVKKIARATAKAAAESATQAGIKTVQDVITGENIGDSLKKNTVKAGQQVLDTLIEKTADKIIQKKESSKAADGNNIKKKKQAVKRSMKYVKLKKAGKVAKKDIFD